MPPWKPPWKSQKRKCEALDTLGFMWCQELSRSPPRTQRSDPYGSSDPYGEPDADRQKTSVKSFLKSF